MLLWLMNMEFKGGGMVVLEPPKPRHRLGMLRRSGLAWTSVLILLLLA